MSAIRVGSEFLVNTATTSDQLGSAVAALSGGGFVVTWEDDSRGVGGAPGDGEFGAVKSQRYGADGARIGGEFLVNSTTGGAQYQSAVATLIGGNFVVAWTSNNVLSGGVVNGGVKAQRYSAAGAPLGTEFFVNAASAEQQSPSIASLSDGGFVVIWRDYVGAAGGDASGAAVKGQRFDNVGARVGGDFLVNTATASYQEFSSVAAFVGGGFVVTWTDNSAGVGGAGGDASGTAIKGQRYNATGARLGSEFLVNSSTAGDQRYSSVATLAGGGFVVTWLDANSFPVIRAQVYGADGARAGGEIVIDASAYDYSANNSHETSVVALSNGAFVVTWNDNGASGDPAGAAISGQAFSAAGARIGTQFLVNTATRSNQLNSAVASLGGGDFVVTWDDDSQGVGGAGGDTSSLAIKGQRFHLDVGLSVGADSAALLDYATASGNVLTNDSGAGALAVASVFAGGATTAVPGSGSVIVAGLYGALTIAANGAYSYAANAEGLTVGQTYVDSFLYTANDGASSGQAALTVTVTGSSVGNEAANTLIGGAGADQLYGGLGSDQLTGGAGADYMDGGQGYDYARYDASATGVVVRLDYGFGQGGDAQGDTLLNFESVIGSGQNDTLIGSANGDALYGQGGVDVLIGLAGNDILDGGLGADQIYGGDGDDLIYGGAGGDYLIGDAGNDQIDGGAAGDYIDAGAGFDLIRYDGSAAGVVARLDVGIGSGGDAEGDTLVNFEGIVGSASQDFLIGGSNEDVLFGQGGNDWLYGQGGADQLYGGDGSDQIIGGAAADQLYGGVGNDVFWFLNADFQAGVFDTIADFGESASNFDYLRFEGLTSALTLTDSGANLIVSTAALAGAGGVIVQNFSVAQVQDQLIFA